MHSLVSNDENFNKKNEAEHDEKVNAAQQFSMTSFSIQSSNGLVCRICYGNEKKECLMRPCNCAGTMGYIHKSCLEKWLASSNSNQCEICTFKYSIARAPKSFLQWLVNPSSINDFRNFKTDTICFLVLTPVAVICTWLCIYVVLQYDDWENKFEAAGIIISTFFVMLIYTIWCMVAFRYNYRVFKEWQAKNQIVSLINNESTHGSTTNAYDNHTLSISLSSQNDSINALEQQQSVSDSTNHPQQEQLHLQEDDIATSEQKAFLI